MGGGKGKGDKGDKGKDKGSGKWAPRKKGSRADLKHFRKGLKHQMQRAIENLEAAKASKNDVHIDVCEHRVSWTQRKQDLLDTGHVMVWDMPSVHNGIRLDYGRLDDVCARTLTEREVQWNAEMRSTEEAATAETATPTAAPRGSASATSSATPAAGGRGRGGTERRAVAASVGIIARRRARFSAAAPAPAAEAPTAGPARMVLGDQLFEWQRQRLGFQGDKWQHSSVPS